MSQSFDADGVPLRYMVLRTAQASGMVSLTKLSYYLCLQAFSGRPNLCLLSIQSGPAFGSQSHYCHLFPIPPSPSCFSLLSKPLPCCGV
jgi:hypothetical protein